MLLFFFTQVLAFFVKVKQLFFLNSNKDIKYKTHKIQINIIPSNGGWLPNSKNDTYLTEKVYKHGKNYFLYDQLLATVIWKERLKSLILKIL